MKWWAVDGILMKTGIYDDGVKRDSLGGHSVGESESLANDTRASDLPIVVSLMWFRGTSPGSA